MSFIDLVRQRRSVRRYLEKPVERDKLERCLEAARLAPSASNSQPWHFVIVEDAARRSRVARETIGPFRSFNTFTARAPLLVVVDT